jgi:hypothetical protein
VDAGQGAQKVPAAVDGSARAAGLLKLVARLEDGALGASIETFRIEKRALIVVAQQAHARFLDHEIKALAGVGAVADNIAQAEDFLDALSADIVEHGLERFQVAVNIADNSPFQLTARRGGSTLEWRQERPFAGNPVV